jgi:hypothetical protein
MTVPPSQFAMWQQQMQMMESFHRDMVLMVQMFLAMHREHRVAIRDELERVRKLTRKLNSLQETLTQTERSDEENRSEDDEHRARKVGKAKSHGRNGTQPSQSTSPPRDASRGQSHPTRPPGALGHRAGTPKTTSPDNTRKAAKPPVPPVSHAELHSQLTQRITELQRERQSYWQRILSAISK